MLDSDTHYYKMMTLIALSENLNNEFKSITVLYHYHQFELESRIMLNQSSEYQSLARAHVALIPS